MVSHADLVVAPSCMISGGGRVLSSTFGGTAKSTKDAVVYGTWHHRTADGQSISGRVGSLICSRNGGQAPPRPTPDSIAEWSGDATVDGARGFSFTANAQDHGEPQETDTYTIVVEDVDGNGYTTSGIIESGNFQIHGPDPGHQWYQRPTVEVEARSGRVVDVRSSRL